MSNDTLTPEQINQMLYRYEHTAEKIASLEQFGEREIDFYREQGYLAVDHVLDEEAIRDALDGLMDIVHLRTSTTREQFKQSVPKFNRDALERYMKEDYVENVNKNTRETPFIQLSKPAGELKTPSERDLATRKVAWFVEFDNRLKKIAMHPQLIGTIERIFGEKPKLVQDMALLKPPHGGAEKPWHQDMAYRGLNYERPVIGVWIALDEAESENGCMHIIPRSHMDGGVPHYAVRDWQICDDNVSVQRDVMVPLKAGGVLFFHGMLHHGTPNNFSDKRRRALQFHFAPESAELVTPQEYKRMFTNVMSGAQC